MKKDQTFTGKAQAMWRGIVGRTNGHGRYGDHYKKLGRQITREEFIAFVWRSKRYEKLYWQWHNSGFNSHLAPSVDRIDPTRGYSLQNIRIIAFGDNRAFALAKSGTGATVAPLSVSNSSMADVRLNTRLLPKHHKALTSIAKRRKVSMSSLVREAVEALIKVYKK